MMTLVTGAFGCIGACVCKRLLESYQRDPGPAPRTGIKDGIRRTLDEFAALQEAGRLDARELAPAT
jgi:UDP-glucose 4-epimerase